jgi:hypothetical protein
VAHHKVPVDAQLFAEFSDLVLEQLSERLNQFQLARDISRVQRHDDISTRKSIVEIKYLERVGQSSNVVVCFDSGARS